MNTTIQTKKVVYTAKVHTTGGRDGGSARSSDGRLEVKFSVPGGLGDGTNPEQLFAAGWSGCFTSALKISAAQMKVKLPSDLAIDAEVDLCKADDGHFIQGRLNVSLPGLDREIARSLIEAADQRCPYSKATRGNMDAALNLI